MFMRRVFELSLFGFYWFGLSLIAFKYVYHKWLVQELHITTLIGQWPSFFLFLFILVIIYFILRYLMWMLYAKCKLSEKRLLTNLKKECRSLESGMNGNSEVQNSTESLLSEPNKDPKATMKNRSKFRRPMRPCGKSMENLSTVKLAPMMKQTKSLENILKPVNGDGHEDEEDEDTAAAEKRKLGNINYGNSIENLAGNSKYSNAIYTDLTESLRNALMKRNKSAGLENNTTDEMDAANVSVDDLLKIYENFYEIQNSLERNKKPMRRAPRPPPPPPPPPPPQPVTSVNPQIHQNLSKKLTNPNLINSSSKNLLKKKNTNLRTVDEKCHAKRLW